MTQHTSVSTPVYFASGVDGLHWALPAQAHRPNKKCGQKSQHYQLRARSKKSAAHPGDPWQRRYPPSSPVLGSTRAVVPHVPQAASGVWVATSRLLAASDCDRLVAIRPLNGLIPMPLLGKALTAGNAMVTVVYDNAKGLATERFGMNERMEIRAQLWLGELLNEPGRMEALKRYVLRRHTGAAVGEKFKDIRQMALLDAWRRIGRAIAQGSEVQRGNEEDLHNLDAEGPRDVDRVLCEAIRKNDKDAFKGMAKTLIFNQINYKAAELTRKETQETIQTVLLDPATAGTTPPRRGENLAPNDYSEGNGNSLIDPDQHYPDTPQEVEEREENQREGQRLKQSWLNWLQNIHDRTPDANHKQSLKACIDFEHLAFADDGEVRINKKIRKPGDDDPYLYHAFLGRTHGAREQLAEQYGISLRYFEKELHLMRNKYWRAWVASVREEMN